MLSSLPGTALACGSAACRPQRTQHCHVHRRQLTLQSQQIRRVPHAAPHQSAIHIRRFLVPGGGVSVRCVAPAPEQPDGQSQPEITKQCSNCGQTHTLFYFPVRKSRPDGWVHCYACQYKLRLDAKPPRRVEDDEHAPTDEPQDCIKCRRTLPAGWFHLDPARSRGRKSTCLACIANKACPASREKRQVPRQKRCGRCQQLLEVDCFSRHRRKADGLQSFCRECFKSVSKERKQALCHVAVPSKRCTRCKKDKPAAAFHPEQRTVDGLFYECKDCMRARNRHSYRQRRTQQQ